MNMAERLSDEPCEYRVMHPPSTDHADEQSAGPSRAGPTKKRKHSKRFNRSKTGCLSCRRRRIRCDEVHPICERCSESKTVCEWAASDPTSSGPSRASSISRSIAGPPSVANGLNARSLDNSVLGGNGALTDIPAQDWTEGAGAVRGLGGLGGVDRGVVDQAITRFHSDLPMQAGTPAGLVDVDPWTAFFGQYSFDSHPDTLATSNLLDFFAPSSTGTSQMTSRRSSPRPPSVRPPALPLATALPEPPPALSMSAHSTLASRRRVHFSASTPVPLSIPPVIHEPIEHGFPSAGSKRLFQHVCSKTSAVIVALGSGHYHAKNPFLAMTTRMMLVDPTSNAQIAFRHSLLSLASAHVAQQHHRASPVQCREMRVRTAKSKRKALLHLYMDSEKELAGYTDLLLATCLTVFLRNKLWADELWKQSLDTALAFINRCGGPLALLSTADQSPDRRFLVEQIAVADLFSTFTTGCEPKLLGQGAGWWESGSVFWTETQWESFERVLGISRHMTESVAAYRVIMSRYQELADEMWLQSKVTAAAQEGLAKQAKVMLEDLERSSANQVNIPARKRIMNGDLAYRYMIDISLSSEVLGCPASDTRIQAAVKSVLELCSEMSRESSNLIWPLLTAGAYAVTASDRDWCSQLLTATALDRGSDIEVAKDILHEQWTRMDCGKTFTPWPIVMRDLRQQVCLM